MRRAAPAASLKWIEPGNAQLDLNLRTSLSGDGDVFLFALLFLFVLQLSLLLEGVLGFFLLFLLTFIFFASVTHGILLSVIRSIPCQNINKTS
jgi:hypothetical protein